MTRGHFRGHRTVWLGDEDKGRWVYEDTGEPLPASGGKARPCLHCGRKFPLGEGEVDACLGVLPGVDNACCGHGIRAASYIRFENGMTVQGFLVNQPDGAERVDQENNDSRHQNP